VEATDIAADEEVRPAITVVVDGVRASRSDGEIQAHARRVEHRAVPGVEIEPVRGGQAVCPERGRAGEQVRVAVIVRVQDGAVPPPPRRVGHEPLMGLTGEGAPGLLDVELV
jgi:hypothetical protein